MLWITIKFIFPLGGVNSQKYYVTLLLAIQGLMISCISQMPVPVNTPSTPRDMLIVSKVSKSGNSKKDQSPSSVTGNKDSSSFTNPVDTEDVCELNQDVKGLDMRRRVADKENFYRNPIADDEKPSATFSSNYGFSGREESGGASVSATIDRDRFEMKGSLTGFSQKTNSNQRSVDPEEKVQKVSPPPRRKGSRDEKSEKDGASINSSSNSQQQGGANQSTSAAPKQYEAEVMDEDINAILEEEEALIAAHRKEIEDTMEIEVKLLAEVDQPGSLIDNYVTQLSFVLSRKAASLVSLQAQLARFQHRLKEQEILSRKKDP